MIKATIPVLGSLRKEHYKFEASLSLKKIRININNIKDNS